MDAGLLAQLGGLHALVLKEVGDFDAGEGMRVSLLPRHLLVQFENDSMETHLLVELVSVLDGIMLMNKKGES